jgi:hypothetical protein
VRLRREGERESGEEVRGKGRVKDGTAVELGWSLAVNSRHGSGGGVSEEEGARQWRRECSTSH